MQMGWRGEKIMQPANASALEVPGVRRRITRYRSWWNKAELYPPSVDRWLYVRAAFFEDETAHARRYRNSPVEEARCAAEDAVHGAAGGVGRHMVRGALLCFCRPFSVLSWHDR